MTGGFLFVFGVLGWFSASLALHNELEGCSPDLDTVQKIVVMAQVSMTMALLGAVMTLGELI